MPENESPETQNLSSNSHTEVAPASRGGGGPVNVAEGALERGLDRLWVRFSHRPLVGAAVAGGVGLAAAAMFGAAELALAAGVGYATYQVLKRRVPPGQALKEAFKLEKELA